MLAPLAVKQEVVGSKLSLFTIFFINSVEFYKISLGKTLDQEFGYNEQPATTSRSFSCVGVLSSKPT